MWSHHFMGNGWGNSGNSARLYFSGFRKSLQMLIAAMKLKDAYSLEGKLWPTETAYWKVETLLCQQRSTYWRLWFFQWSCRYESWTIKKAEHWKINAFGLWCWRRLLRFSWTGRRSNQSILKEVSPEYSLEGLMLKLKLQYFGHLMRRVVIAKYPDAGKD